MASCILVVNGFWLDAILAGHRISKAGNKRVRAILTFDQLHDEGVHAVRIFKALNVRDVRMVEGGEDLRLALKACEPFGVVRK